MPLRLEQDNALAALYQHRRTHRSATEPELQIAELGMQLAIQNQRNLTATTFCKIGLNRVNGSLDLEGTELKPTSL